MLVNQTSDFDKLTIGVQHLANKEKLYELLKDFDHIFSWDGRADDPLLSYLVRATYGWSQLASESNEEVLLWTLYRVAHHISESLSPRLHAPCPLHYPLPRSEWIGVINVVYWATTGVSVDSGEELRYG